MLKTERIKNKVVRREPAVSIRAIT